MSNELRGVDRGAGNEGGHFTGRAMPGAVSPGVKVASDGPDKSAGICSAPMAHTPHRLDQPREARRSRVTRGAV
jgi:hypothetical protein